MADERRHESADLEDYETLDAYDTLDGPPGDDPLDRGVVTPERWSAAMKYGTTAEEQRDGESLDRALSEEQPDFGADEDDDESFEEDLGLDENAPEDDVDRFQLDQGADPRSGRLIAEDEGAHAIGEPDAVAYDAGIDGGGATAEEAAVHMVVDEDTETDTSDWHR